MIYSIENQFLKIEVATAGAELKSLFHKGHNQEFIWQGNADWWPRRAPVLFPIVGKLNKNEFRIGENIFKLPQHGFARDMDFDLTGEKSDRLVFVLRSTETTLEKYPFEFALKIEYILRERHLLVRYEVRNPGDDDLYFSIGAHPGFALQPGETLSDYYVEFEKSETLDRHLLEEGLFTGKTERVVTHSKTLDLNDDMMKKDAVVFTDMKSDRMVLKSHKSAYTLKFTSPGFSYFGIWSKPGASFVCLEPWCGKADNKGFSGELQEKEGIQLLEPGKVFEKAFSIEPGN